MKKSTIVHFIAGVISICGILALIAAWIAGESGTISGLSQQHLYNDAIVLTLISISALVCAIVYLQQEKSQ